MKKKVLKEEKGREKEKVTKLQNCIGK